MIASSNAIVRSSSSQRVARDAPKARVVACQYSAHAPGPKPLQLADPCRRSRVELTGRYRPAPAAAELAETSESPTSTERHVSRRSTLLTSVLASGLSFGTAAGWDTEAYASELPSAIDQLWTSMGGGPPDLFYPEEFLGTWQVTSTLVNVETPAGEEILSDSSLYTRAKSELNMPLTYLQRFIRGSEGEVISDRAFNLTNLTTSMTGRADIFDQITWDPDNPNDMTLSVKGMDDIFTRVTKRFQDLPGGQRLDTSEVIEQVFNTRPGEQPKVKQSRCLTKYRWRDEVQAQEGPTIVATQVVSDFVTPFDGEAKMLEARGRPQLVYTYRMSFQRQPARAASAPIATSLSSAAIV